MVKKSLRWDPEVERQQEAKASRRNPLPPPQDEPPAPPDPPLPTHHRPTVFNLAGKDVFQRRDGKPGFGGSLLRVTRMHRKRGNQVIYHDLADFYDDFHTGQNFPFRLKQHFSGAVVAKGFTLISPTQPKAARYLDPSLTLDHKTPLQRGNELAGKTPLQRGMVCCRWQFPECHQVLVVRGGDRDSTPERHEADYGVDTYYEVVEQDGVSIEEQTIFFLCRALGSDVSTEEEEVLNKLLKKFQRQSF
ncbi:hypothetical protein AYO20_11581 [Fonsecaea nubica]|uniref:Uncharacterized protein n=1 Tax=Fonsecaea nubica TaxID=856822 RepID=A0A178BQW0_9EURO|nr:hypothetical protein AYO20_11581 [Fonsecaea nubica]OAL19727.1 hypothetical protein AYO20_11581 [Fonsecaea nubica]